MRRVLVAFEQQIIYLLPRSAVPLAFRPVFFWQFFCRKILDRIVRCWLAHGVGASAAGGASVGARSALKGPTAQCTQRRALQTIGKRSLGIRWISILGEDNKTTNTIPTNKKTTSKKSKNNSRRPLRTKAPSDRLNGDAASARLAGQIQELIFLPIGAAGTGRVGKLGGLRVFFK